MRFSNLLFLILLIFPIIELGQEISSLTDDDLDFLAITERIDGITQIEAGKSLQFNLYRREQCCDFRLIKTQVIWSVEPKTGANIDSVSGLLNIADNIPNGAVYTVTANVENGRRLVAEKVYIFNRSVNPFVGKWKEKIPPAACGRKVLYFYDPTMGPPMDLSINVDGTFLAGWFGFEDRFTGSSGKYSYNLKTRIISFDVTARSEVFKDLKNIGGNGTFKLINDQLLLNNIWFRQTGWSFFNKDKKQPSDCYLVFERR